MKYLSDYTREAITQAFDMCHAFYAFSDKQFEEQKQDGIEYVSMFGGIVCPKDNTETLREALNNAIDEGRSADMAENGKNRIIRREINNHECGYTGDITDAVNVLSGYGITREEVQAVFKTMELDN